jgi:integrase
MRALQHDIPNLCQNGVYKPIIEPNSMKDYLREVMPKMSKGEINELRTTVAQYHTKRFKRNHYNKYGNLNKGFEEPQLQAFMKAVDSSKLKLLFTYQSTLGLRVGEAVKVNIKDINFETRELKVFTEKARQLDAMLIPIPLFKETIEFIQQHKEEIEDNKGYLFFVDRSTGSKREQGYIEPNYVRNKFHKYLELSGLSEVYALSDENGHKSRRLFRLTTHSLRHYAITRFARNSNGNLILTSRFARHINPNTTTTYINTNRKEVFDVIDAIAVSEVAMLKKRMVE